MAGGVLGAADIQVDVAPVLVSLAADQGAVVVRIHVAEVVGAGARKARHGALLERIAVPGPVLGARERRFAVRRRLVGVDLRQAQRQRGERQRGRDAVLVANRERLAPVALARENGIAQAVVGLAAAEALRLDVVLGGLDGLLDGHAVQEAGVAHDAVLGIETLLRDVAALNERDDGEVKLFRESVVAAVVGRHGHDGAGAVAREDVFGDPDGDLLPGHGVDAVGAGEHARDRLGLGDALALRLLLHVFEVLGHLRLAVGGGQRIHQLALGGEDHEGHAVDRVGAGGEDGHRHLAAVADGLEHHLRAFGAADPVALHLLEGVGPVELLERVKQAAGVGRHAQLPLRHLLLLHGIAAAHAQAVLDLVVGEHGAETLAPVDGGLALVGDAVAHQDVRFLFLRSGFPLRRGHVLVAGALEFRDQLGDRARLVHGRIIPAVEHLQEGPLRPLVERRVAGAHLAVPVVGEADAVQLLTVAGDVLLRRHLRVLARLDGVLLGRQAEGVVAHRVQHVEALQALVAREDIAGDIAQRVPHVQSGSGRIGKHVQHIEFRLRGIFHHAEGLVCGPAGLPLALNRFEIVIHYTIFSSFSPI